MDPRNNDIWSYYLWSPVICANRSPVFWGTNRPIAQQAIPYTGLVQFLPCRIEGGIEPFYCIIVRQRTY